MKKLILAAVTLAAAILISAPSTASATECVPRDAYTETIEHPAVGDPTITIENPDYIPATEDETVLEGYIKWEWTGGPADWPAWPGPGWNSSGFTNDTKGSTPDVVQRKGEGNAYFYFESSYTTIPGAPAVGDPTLTIDNPDYTAPWTEVVEHEAIECETTTPENPGGEAPCGTGETETSSGACCETRGDDHPHQGDDACSGDPGTEPGTPGTDTPTQPLPETPSMVAPVTTITVPDSIPAVDAPQELALTGATDFGPVWNAAIAAFVVATALFLVDARARRRRRQ